MKKPEWLPDWFDLKNYDSVADFELGNWAEALHAREFIRSKMTKTTHEANNELKARLAHLSKNPSDGWDHGDNFDELPFWYDSFSDSPDKMVTSLNVGTIAAVWSEITSDGDGAIFKNDLEDMRSPNDPELKKRYDHLEGSTTSEIYLSRLPEGRSFLDYTGGITYAKVDICAPDELLIKDFKQWLKDTRSLLKIDSHSSSFSSENMAEWHKKRVLPYIDLAIWAKLTGITPTQQEIGIVLFPDDYHISLDARIRRTVKPLADKLMMHSTIATIGMQAAHSDDPDNLDEAT